MTEHLTDYVMTLTQQALKPENIISGRCFLCGGTPTNGNGEHVFPLWLQNRFDLLDERLTLLNGTLIPYRNVRIPACKACNGRVLCKAESYVSELQGSDVLRWSHTHSFEVGRWLAKILIGILIKEASLQIDRRSPERGMIFPANGIDDFLLIHLLVQSWRKFTTFKSLHTVHPFTLYVYEIEADKDFSEFDLSTNLFGKSLCIRFGNLGFAFVADGGLQHEMAEFGPYNLGFKKLHPVQFDELAARVHYKSSLRDATHQYLHYENPDRFDFNQVRVTPYTDIKLEDGSDRVFREWSARDFASFLKRYGGPNYNYLVDETGCATYTFLVDATGAKQNIPPGSFFDWDQSYQ